MVTVKILLTRMEEALKISMFSEIWDEKFSIKAKLFFMWMELNLEMLVCSWINAQDHPPGFIYHPRFPIAGEFLDVRFTRAVDRTPVRLANIQEVRSQPADRVLADVGEGLAHGSAEQEGADCFIDAGNIAVAERGL